MFPKELVVLTNRLISACLEKEIKLAVAESCTGGLISACITSVAGSSNVFERGFTTYSNDAKSEMLDIPLDMIVTHGAVSEPLARAMCEGALIKAPVQLTAAVTGIAGPSGGTIEKPVGTVHIASARVGKDTMQRCYLFKGSRDEIRISTIKNALEMMLSQV